MNPFKKTLIQKLALLLFINSNNQEELKTSQKIIFSALNYTKLQIIELIEMQETCKRCDQEIKTHEEVEQRMCFECMEIVAIQDENSNFRNLNL